MNFCEVENHISFKNGLEVFTLRYYTEDGKGGTVNLAVQMEL